MKVFMKLHAQNYHHCSKWNFKCQHLIIHGIRTGAVPLKFSFVLNDTLYIPVFLIVRHSCSRVAWFRLSERFVGFKETGLLSSPKFPLQSLSDSSVIEYYCGLCPVSRRKFNLSFTGPKSAYSCPSPAPYFTCPSSLPSCL